MRAGSAGESVFSAHLTIRLAHRNSANAARGLEERPNHSVGTQNVLPARCYVLWGTLPASMLHRTGQMNELYVMVRLRLEYYLDTRTNFPLAST